MKRSGVREWVLTMPRRGTVLLYTHLMRPRFAFLGKGSRIAPPLRVNDYGAVWAGDRVFISEGAWLNAKRTEDGGPSLHIGDGTYIGRFAHINSLQDVRIEQKVLIADRVYISDEEHVFTDTRLPIIEQGTRFQGSVVLRTGCWIGEGVSIIPGVTVGRNAVVAANAVVTEDVPDYAVTAGVPAKVVKSLSPPTPDDTARP